MAYEDYDKVSSDDTCCLLFEKGGAVHFLGPRHVVGKKIGRQPAVICLVESAAPTAASASAAAPPIFAAFNAVTSISRTVRRRIAIGPFAGRPSAAGGGASELEQASRR